MLFLLKIYQLFHSCEDNPEIVVIVLVQGEPELWGTEKKKVFLQLSDPQPQLMEVPPLWKSILPQKDWTEDANILMLLFSSLFVNGLPISSSPQLADFSKFQS